MHLEASYALSFKSSSSGALSNRTEHDGKQIKEVLSRMAVRRVSDRWLGMIKCCSIGYVYVACGKYALGVSLNNIRCELFSRCRW